MFCALLGIEYHHGAGGLGEYVAPSPLPSGDGGGHCISVHPYSLTHKAEQVGYHPREIPAGRRINDTMRRHAVRYVVRTLLHNGPNVARSTVGGLGGKVKEDCPIARWPPWCGSSRAGGCGWS